MKVIQTISDFGKHSGGTTTATYDLLSALSNLESAIDVELMSPDVRDKRDTVIGNGENWINISSNDRFSPLEYTMAFKTALNESDADIYHTNGVWLYVNHVTCSVARAKNKPYVITPHGMLYPETIHRSYWKKWPMWKLWFKKDIMEASCIHVNCLKEMNHIRDLGYSGPVAVIANPVPVSDDITRIYENRSLIIRDDITKEHSIGYLGRLHPRKHVERIIQALAISSHKDVVLKIMGIGSTDYEEFLNKETERLSISDRVHFLGFVSGRDKYENLAKLSALFVVSDMENFGMIVPEALLVGTPVMASLGTPWKNLEDYKCGWWRDNSPESIAKVIDEVAETSPDELLRMGMRGRELVLDKYESSKVAAKMLKLYSWLLGQGPKPEFVYLS